RPGALAAFGEALHAVDRAMAFDDPSRIEAGLLELAVHVARTDEVALRPSLAPSAKDREAFVRLGFPIRLQPMIVGAPGKGRPFMKGLGVRCRGKAQARPLQRKIGSPDTLVAPKIGEAGADAHAGTGR